MAATTSPENPDRGPHQISGRRLSAVKGALSSFEDSLKGDNQAKQLRQIEIMSRAAGGDSILPDAITEKLFSFCRSGILQDLVQAQLLSLLACTASQHTQVREYLIKELKEGSKTGHAILSGLHSGYLKRLEDDSELGAAIVTFQLSRPRLLVEAVQILGMTGFKSVSNPQLQKIITVMEHELPDAGAFLALGISNALLRARASSILRDPKLKNPPPDEMVDITTVEKRLLDMWTGLAFPSDAEVLTDLAQQEALDNALSCPSLAQADIDTAGKELDKIAQSPVAALNDLFNQHRIIVATTLLEPDCLPNVSTLIRALSEQAGLTHLAILYPADKVSELERIIADPHALLDFDFLTHEEARNSSYLAPDFSPEHLDNQKLLGDFLRATAAFISIIPFSAEHRHISGELEVEALAAYLVSNSALKDPKNRILILGKPDTLIRGGGSDTHSVVEALEERLSESIGTAALFDIPQLETWYGERINNLAEVFASRTQLRSIGFVPSDTKIGDLKYFEDCPATFRDSFNCLVFLTKENGDDSPITHPPVDSTTLVESS